MLPTLKRYIIITPTRDDIQYAYRTIESILAQTIRPARWIIVDDGSTDGTGALLDAVAQQYPWISIVHRPDRGRRSVGPGVIDAFYAGADMVNLEDYDYLCKLDLDLDLPPRYFERLMEHMHRDPRLGTVSGKPYYQSGTAQLVPEVCGNEMSVGMSKFYRVACYREIGGFARTVMWDGIDCHRCRLLGWRATSINEAALRFIHLRPMGSSDGSIIAGRIRHGYGQYVMGTSFTYMTVSALFRMWYRPRIAGGAAMWYGYLKSMLTGASQYDDTQFRRFLHYYQRRCLLHGKARATHTIEAQLRCRWRHSTHNCTTRASASASSDPRQIRR